VRGGQQHPGQHGKHKRIEQGGRRLLHATEVSHCTACNDNL
jgi:hypothetical protein